MHHNPGHPRTDPDDDAQLELRWNRAPLTELYLGPDCSMDEVEEMLMLDSKYLESQCTLFTFLSERLDAGELFTRWVY